MGYSMADTIAMHAQSKGVYNRSQRDMKSMLAITLAFCVGALIARNVLPLGVACVSFAFAIQLGMRMVRAGRRERELAPQAREAIDFLNKAGRP